MTEVMQATDLSTTNLHQPRRVYCCVCHDDEVAEPNRLYTHGQYCYDVEEMTSPTNHCCHNCLNEYVSTVILSGYAGTCQPLYCPICRTLTTASKNHLLNYNFLVQQFPQLMTTYEERAASILSIQCGSCHRRGSIHITTTAIAQAQSTPDDFQWNNHIAPAGYQELVDLTMAFNKGWISISDTFERVVHFFPILLEKNLWNEAWNIMKHVLFIITNPERRANLYLRFIRSQPKVQTLCCRKYQCFHCKTKEFHEGKTCEEIAAHQDNHLVVCRQCGIHLVKGDGCDSVTCVCGRNFAWSNEVTTSQHCFEFRSTYPHDTEFHCVNILCGTETGNGQHAKGWEQFNKLEFERGLLGWWKRQYPMYTTLFSILPKSYEGKNEYGRKAGDSWTKLHAKEASSLKSQRQFALNSLADTWYPTDYDKACYLWSSRQNSRTRDVIKQSLIGDSDVKVKVTGDDQSYVAHFKNRAVQQFLCCFGHMQVALSPSPSGSFFTLPSAVPQVQTDLQANLTNLLAQISLSCGDVVTFDNFCGSSGSGVITSVENGTYTIQSDDNRTIEGIRRIQLKKMPIQKFYVAKADMSIEQKLRFREFMNYLHFLLSPANVTSWKSEAASQWRERWGSDAAATEAYRRISPIVDSLRNPLISDLSHFQRDYEDIIKEMDFKWKDLYNAASWKGVQTI